MADSARRLKVFKDETAGYVKKIREGLALYLELRPSSGTIKEMHRSAHNIKGIAGLLDLQAIAALGLRLEMIFEKVQEGHSYLVGEGVGLVEELLSDLDAELSQVDQLIIQMEQGSARANAFEGERKNILLIEDEPLTAELIKDVIMDSEDFQASVYTAFTLQDANLLLASKHYDLILLDLTLPDSSGLATLAAVQSKCRGALILVMTGYREEIVAHFRREGISEVLIKGDFDSGRLRMMVSKYLRR